MIPCLKRGQDRGVKSHLGCSFQVHAWVQQRPKSSQKHIYNISNLACSPKLAVSSPRLETWVTLADPAEFDIECREHFQIILFCRRHEFTSTPFGCIQNPQISPGVGGKQPLCWCDLFEDMTSHHDPQMYGFLHRSNGNAFWERRFLMLTSLWELFCMIWQQFETLRGLFRMTG